MTTEKTPTPFDDPPPLPEGSISSGETTPKSDDEISKTDLSAKSDETGKDITGSTSTAKKTDDKKTHPSSEPMEEEKNPPIFVTYLRLGGEWNTIPYNAQNLDLHQRELVIVGVDEGTYFGIITEPPSPSILSAELGTLPKVLRRANAEDIEKIDNNVIFERDAGKNFREVVRRANLDMKLAGVRSLLDGSRITFYYTADDRVDFREVVRDLARIYHTRIEMWQIGVRDEARRLGGYGICGRQMCCAGFLQDFIPVTMKMAKEQGLTLAPSKISGTCGRLMCCLAFENEWYTAARDSFPHVGSILDWKDRQVKVVSLHFLTNEITVEDMKDSIYFRLPLNTFAPQVETAEET